MVNYYITSGVVSTMKALVRGFMPADKTGLKRPSAYLKCKTWLGVFVSIWKARKEGAGTVIINWKDDER